MSNITSIAEMTGTCVKRQSGGRRYYILNRSCSLFAKRGKGAPPREANLAEPGACIALL